MIGPKQNVEILEGWLIHSILPILAKDGVWAAPDPAPLTAAEVRPVFERIAKLDAYDRQQLETATLDGRVVSLVNGVVSEHGVKGTIWEGKSQVFERGADA